MASGFKYKGDSQNANSGQVLAKVLLADSTAFTIGDALKVDGTNGVAILWGLGGAGLGILVGFEKADGSPVTDNGASGAYTNTYTTPASNTVYGVVDTSLTSLWSVELDAVAGTTTGSDKYGVNIDCLSGSDQLDESSVLAAGTTASFFSHGEDPDPKAPSNSVIVSIQESQVKI